MNKYIFLITLLIVTFSTSAEVKLSILVNPGPFEIDEAASSEKNVNWWDEDLNDDRGCTETFAAEELKKFICRVTSLENESVVISSRKEIIPEHYTIILGSRVTQPLIKLYDPEGNFECIQSEGAFCWRVFKEGKQNICIIEGYDRVGVLYGVYDFLEVLGIRFYGLGEKGTCFPKEIKELPLSGFCSEKPDFRTRGFAAYENRGDKDFFLWMARNRMNY